MDLYGVLVDATARAEMARVPRATAAAGTLALSVRLAALPSDRAGLVSHVVLGGLADETLRVWVDHRGRVGLRLRNFDGLYAELASAPGAVAINTWHVVSVSWGAHGLRLAVGYELVAGDDTWTHGYDLAMSELVLGALHQARHLDRFEAPLVGAVHSLVHLCQQLLPFQVVALLSGPPSVGLCSGTTHDLQLPEAAACHEDCLDCDPLQLLCNQCDKRLFAAGAQCVAQCPASLATSVVSDPRNWRLCASSELTCKRGRIAEAPFASRRCKCPVSNCHTCALYDLQPCLQCYQGYALEPTNHTCVPTA